LTYNHSFGKHNVDALVGHENYNLVSNSLDGSRSQQILDGNYELINFTTSTNLTSQYDIRRVEGFFSRLNYDYDSKYLHHSLLVVMVLLNSTKISVGVHSTRYLQLGV